MQNPLDPLVDFCLVCEDVRLEMGNKVILLGFYGLLPRVRIMIEAWERPVEKLTFFVSTHGFTRRFSMQLRLQNPDGTNLIQSIPAFGEPANDNVSTSSVAFSFPMLKFHQQGEHRLEVLIDGSPAYGNTFLVQSSRPTVKTL